MEKNIEYQAGAALVDDGIKFSVDGWFGKKISFTIRPARPGTIARISQRSTLLEPVDEGTIQEFMASGKNLRVIAGIIATAIINSEIHKLWKYQFIKWLILNRTKDITYLYSYLLLVQKQMGPVFFYRIMNLTPAMNYLKKAEKEASSGEAKPFGAPSDSSKKPSDSTIKR